MLSDVMGRSSGEGRGVMIGIAYNAIALVTLSYCVSKTIQDWRARDTWSIALGVVASIGALIFMITMAIFLIMGSFDRGAYP